MKGTLLSLYMPTPVLIDVAVLTQLKIYTLKILATAAKAEART